MTETKQVHIDDPVFEENGEWWFWDEIWVDRLGPYPTEEKANKELKRYCEDVLGD